MNDKLQQWYKRIKEYKEKERQHIPLTKDEQEDWDFMQQKLDDWESDYDMPEGG